MRDGSPIHEEPLLIAQDADNIGFQGKCGERGVEPKGAAKKFNYDL